MRDSARSGPPTGWGDHFAVEPGYLNAASLGVPPLAAVDALRSALEEWARGDATAPGYDPTVARARSLFADLVGVAPEQVAVGHQVSYFAGMVAASLPPGSEVVLPLGDFTSVLFPFLVHEERGVTVRQVALEALADEVRATTALVAFSLVQSADGRIADVDAVLDAAAAVGARTFVDTTQSAGWLPFDAGRADYTVTAGYKWLCNPRGTAFFTVRQIVGDGLVPLHAGWYAGQDVWSSIYGPGMELASSARRYDASPAWLCWVGAVPALELVQGIGVQRLHDHAVGLAAELRAELGVPENGSAIVSLARAGAVEALQAAGAKVAVRAGNVRLGFHLWNDHADLGLTLAALRTAGVAG